MASKNKKPPKNKKSKYYTHGRKFDPHDFIPVAKELARLGDINLIDHFLSDLLTWEEREEISRRFEAAKMLAKGIPYTEIQEELHMSSITLSKLWKRLKEGSGVLANSFSKKLTKNTSKSKIHNLEEYLDWRIRKGK